MKLTWWFFLIFLFFLPNSSGYTTTNILASKNNFSSIIQECAVTDLSQALISGARQPIKISKQQAFKLLRLMGLTAARAQQVIYSFTGPIYATQGNKHDLLIVAHNRFRLRPGIFFTLRRGGDNRKQRVELLALPPGRRANLQELVVLTHPQILLQGKIAAKPLWGANRVGGGWQVVTGSDLYIKPIGILLPYENLYFCGMNANNKSLYYSFGNIPSENWGQP